MCANATLTEKSTARNPTADPADPADTDSARYLPAVARLATESTPLADREFGAWKLVTAATETTLRRCVETELAHMADVGVDIEALSTRQGETGVWTTVVLR